MRRCVRQTPRDRSETAAKPPGQRQPQMSPKLRTTTTRSNDDESSNSQGRVQMKFKFEVLLRQVDDDSHRLAHALAGKALHTEPEKTPRTVGMLSHLKPAHITARGPLPGELFHRRGGTDRPRNAASRSRAGAVPSMGCGSANRPVRGWVETW